MAIFGRQFAHAMASGGLDAPASSVCAGAGLCRCPPGFSAARPANRAPPAPAPAQPALSPQPQTAPPAATLPPSMLQQPAREATIQFAGDSLSIHADNSSLAEHSAPVRQQERHADRRADGDERVFGTFGPGAPRDVLADLLNGTAYNMVMVGDLSNGAPRELILSSSTRSGGSPVPSAAPQSNPDDSSNDQESRRQLINIIGIPVHYAGTPGDPRSPARREDPPTIV